MRLVAAAVQMTSRGDLAANLEAATRLVLRAGERGAQLVVLPENFALFPAAEEAKLGAAETLEDRPPGPILTAMGEAARRSGAWLVLGGMPERDPASLRRVFNTAVVLDGQGNVVGRYRKIHLFDATTPDGVAYRESRTVSPGERAEVVSTPWGGLGLSVCYDLRFPELYRCLSSSGARLLAIPAAFTLETGKDHWHLLVRARAVENQCFVLAAAQQGRHSERRATYGHALVVDPWGTPLAEAGDGEGMALAELDLDRIDEVRSALPCLEHRRVGCGPVKAG